MKHKLRKIVQVLPNHQKEYYVNEYYQIRGYYKSFNNERLEFEVYKLSKTINIGLYKNYFVHIFAPYKNKTLHGVAINFHKDTKSDTNFLGVYLNHNRNNMF